jgi:hypothetical protein
MNLPARHPANVDPLLLPPRETPYLLDDVLEKVALGCRDELILDLGECYLRFGVEIDTDTITGQFHPSPFRAKKGYASLRTAKPWDKYVGQECGWTWFGWNQQGYLDTVLISFNGIEPSVLLQTIGSSVEIYTVSPAEKRIRRGRPTPKRRKRRENGSPGQRASAPGGKPG